MLYRGYVLAKVVGLDLSLNSTGLCVMEENSVFTKTITPDKNQTMDNRVNDILKEILCHVDKDTHVFIEDYAYASFPGSSSVTILAEINGVIKHALWSKFIPYYKVPPTTLKKFLTGSGKAKKEDMKLKGYIKYGREFKTSDEVDAFVLAEIGALICGVRNRTLSMMEDELLCKLKVSCNLP